MFLSALIFSPLLFAALLVFLPKSVSRGGSLLFTLAHFIGTLGLFKVFDASSASLQLVEQYDWFPELGVSYFLALDGISFWLVILTSFLTPIVIGASWTSVEKSPKAFHISLLVLEAAMIGDIRRKVTESLPYFPFGFGGGHDRFLCGVR